MAESEVAQLLRRIIARIADMKPEDVYYLEAGCRYNQASIERALLALSTLTGEHFTLDTVGGIYVQAHS
jgi:hypothetical protein